MKNIEQLSNLFKALSDPNRLELLAKLCGRPELNVGDLCGCCKIDVSVVSRHLSKLKGAGVLEASKKGKEVFYSLKGKQLATVLRELADEIEKGTCC